MASLLSWKTRVLGVHRWAGLVLGPVLLVMASTGIINLWRPALEPLISADLLTVAPCSARVPIDVLTANAQLAHPAGKLDYVRILAADPDSQRLPAARVRFTDQLFVYLNPCTGDVLGERMRYGGLLGRVEQLHIFRYRADRERSLVSPLVASAFALVLIGGGLFVWWPRHAAAAKVALQLKTRLRGPARSLHRHKTLGVYVCLILLLQVATALPLSFAWYKDGLYRLTGSALPAPAPLSRPPPSSGAATVRLSMESFWQVAQRLVPGAKDTLMHVPVNSPTAALDAYMIAPDAPHVNARAMLYVDAYSGEVLRFVPYADSSPGHKLYFWTLSFHMGTVGGLAGKLVLMGSTGCLLFIGFLGIRSYVRRQLHRQAAP